MIIHVAVVTIGIVTTTIMVYWGYIKKRFVEETKSFYPYCCGREVIGVQQAVRRRVSMYWSVLSLAEFAARWRS